MKAPSDEDLVRSFRAGDEGALQTLRERHAPALRSVARRGLPPAVRRKVAESDVVQEGFVVAMRRLAEFEDRGKDSFRKWLRRIVELKIKEHVRHHSRQRRRAQSELSRGARPETRDFPGCEATPSAHAIARETQAALLAAIETLPPAYGDVLRLVHDQGFTVEEAAASLGRTPEATRKLYSRAIGRLGQVLESGAERR